MRIAVMAVVAFLLAGMTPTRATGQSKPGTSSPTLHLETCRLPGWDENVRCGKYEVFENRKAKAGRKIALRLLVLPARSAHPAPDPIFYFMGGPGGSAVDVVKRSGPEMLANLRAERDIVFVDQRGTGESNPLQCNLQGDKNDMSAYFGDIFPIDKITACRDELGKIADLKLYTTTIAMEDLDEIRAALGYDTINLYGGSYGSTAAMVYMRNYPKHVRTATISGVAPPDMKLPLGFSKGVDNAIAKVFADCAADPKCGAAYPNLKGDLEASLHFFDKGPVKVETVNPLTRQPQTVMLPRHAFADIVRVMLYTPEYSQTLPLLVHQTAHGNFGSFVAAGYLYYRGFDDLIARGMHFCVTCAEDVPFVTDADIARETPGTFYGADRMQAYRKVCEVWPRGDTPKDFATPVKSDVPTLLIAGEADPVAPPWLAAEAARHLPNGRLVVIPHTGHAFEFDCVNALITAFVAKGSAKDLDPSCLARIARPAFVTDADVAAMQRPADTPPASAVQENYEGVLDVGAAKLRLVLHVWTEDGALKASVDSPDQNAFGLRVDTITRTDSTLHFEMAMIGAAYDATIASEGKRIDGRWKQGGRDWPLVFERKP